MLKCSVCGHVTLFRSCPGCTHPKRKPPKRNPRPHDFAKEIKALAESRFIEAHKRYLLERRTRIGDEYGISGKLRRK